MVTPGGSLTEQPSKRARLEVADSQQQTRAELASQRQAILPLPFDLAQRRSQTSKPLAKPAAPACTAAPAAAAGAEAELTDSEDSHTEAVCAEPPVASANAEGEASHSAPLTRSKAKGLAKGIGPTPTSAGANAGAQVDQGEASAPATMAKATGPDPTVAVTPTVTSAGVSAAAPRGRPPRRAQRSTTLNRVSVQRPLVKAPQQHAIAAKAAPPGAPQLSSLDHSEWIESGNERHGRWRERELAEDRSAREQSWRDHDLRLAQQEQENAKARSPGTAAPAAAVAPPAPKAPPQPQAGAPESDPPQVPQQAQPHATEDLEPEDSESPIVAEPEARPPPSEGEAPLAPLGTRLENMCRDCDKPVPNTAGDGNPNECQCPRCVCLQLINGPERVETLACMHAA